MTKLAYLECPTGIAGDMCLGALVDIGVPLEYLIEQLKGLGIAQEYELQVEPVHRKGQLATKVHVRLLQKHHHGRHLPEIEQLITSAKLPSRAQKWSLEVFRQLAVAEGAVHGIAPEKVHFHEVGAVDAIVDIVGTCLGLDWLKIDKLYCSALPTGGGTVKAAHGRLPVPVPAVLKLWQMRGCPVYSNGIERELVTPTGAAIATIATDFGAPPAMTLHKIGLGAGSSDLPIPNILRLWLGESRGQESEIRNQGVNISDVNSCIETIAVLETQIDDLSPQAIGYVFDALFAAGAVDVFTQSIGMKKSRPGILLTVICHPEQLDACEAVLFQETTTLGIRHSLQQRTILPREIQKVDTEYGTVRVKVAWMEKKLVNVQPEYEDCAQLAKKHQIAWREIHRQALHSWYTQLEN
ncbi:nickel pincer cofactor biosynthesis protein LarC [Gloeocapsopsis dulcis]|uniref:Putative nickel insertion protein n=1 Tax=Gloeocapsopsis dulcis AAB1 = 1H9 TaxID=1433147 RepID=A0A6N8FVC9_9CHRO|nr:nickel pincer cofactor biosynthesis protein LarC [Gloeocapsopsis dulcis]MUL36117.1 TIGR00299 family protein [Gloeocapsopsis dulcis AAB1 = 1H9]WNN91411.1 nickel pincer cofactor biosynthesis protein LarC [Gloeocapsopsis dulcis]